MEINVVIGNILKELRKERNETQEDVSRGTGISDSLLSKYERGASEPGLRALKKLADYYDVSLDYLFGVSRERKHSVEELREIYSKLDEQKKREALQFMRFIKEK